MGQIVADFVRGKAAIGGSLVGDGWQARRHCRSEGIVLSHATLGINFFRFASALDYGQQEGTSHRQHVITEVACHFGRSSCHGSARRVLQSCQQGVTLPRADPAKTYLDR